MEEKQTSGEGQNKYPLSVASIGILVVFLIVVFVLYMWVSKKGKGGIIFPAGLNYTGEKTTPAPQRPTYDYEKLGSSSAADWVTFTSPRGQYTFQHPKELYALIFPGDANDSVTFDVSGVPAQFNLMGLVETISNYDSKMVGKQEEFVRNYWSYFPGGLKGLQSFDEFTNEKGLRGYKVTYVTVADQTTSDNYFFMLPNNPDKIMHVNNIFPKEGNTVFLRILNSLDFKK